MFSLCKQTHPATGVEHSLSCHFFNNAERNLVTAGANVLKVYRIIPDVDSNCKEKFTDRRPPKMKLECLASYRLSGNVMSMQHVSLSGSQRDAILISFRDAKLSVVQHDPDTFSLKTLSLHYFEEDEIKGGWTGNYHIPMVRVDPDNRCAVMLVYGRKLVVLPFRKDSSLDEIELQDVKPIKKMPTQLIAKTPILASYIITLKELDEKIDNVIDIQFLHGYYEPTILILYEPVRTFPGRIAVRSDTCTMVALSLNIQQRVHPVIWTVSGLPFDCLQALPVQKPMGGCLVISTNALVYLNQSVPPYGVSLNSIADHSTAFPLKPQDGVKISLDAAQITFIDIDKLVLSLKTGELYVLTLCADSMRSVRSFHFHKAAASVLASCICVCQEEYMFLGSRLGNSLLLRFTEEDQTGIITIEDDEKDKEKDKEKENPKRRLEEEELQVYGSGVKTSVQLTKYIFEVCDSILNIGPIGYMTIGESASEEETMDLDKEDKHSSLKADLEIVTSSGHGKNGALCVLTNSVKPHTITSFELSGCVNVWTVLDEPYKKQNKNEDLHDFMIISQKTSTLVLQTADEINEIENTGFSTSLPTVFVGNLGNNRFIFQVTTRSIRLLQGTRLLQNVPIDVGSPVASAAVADPYVCIRVSNGQVITLALRETKGTPRLAINKNTISSIPKVVSISVYRDISTMFSTKYEDYSTSSSDGSYYGGIGLGYMKPEPNMKIEDEEDLLYGESGSAFKMNTMVDLAFQSKVKNSDWWRRHLQQVKPSYWLFVSRDNGNLEIYSMPDLKLMYLINNTGNGNTILSDSMEFVPMSLAQTTDNSGSNNDISSIGQGSSGPNKAIVALEVLMVALGNQGSRPTLFIRTSNELLIYRVFKYPKGHLKIRFRKISHEIILPPIQSPDDLDETSSVRQEDLSIIKYFGNVAGYNGVAICGANPFLIFLTSRGELRTHKVFGNVYLKTFAAFNNVNCRNGFLYLDNSNELIISVLPNYLSYDSHWPMRKVPIRCTPRQVVFHKQARVYCLVTENEETSNKYYRFNGEDKELTEENKGERYIYPSVEKFSIVLVSPSFWEIIPDASIELEDWEHVTAFKNVSLAYEGTRSGLKEYLCVGTNYNYSEDITSRGRILIYDIVEVVPEPGKPLTKFKLKEVYVKEQKGPVSAITHVLGFLVTAVGQKIYIWQLKDDDLIGVAFIDTNIYVHQMISVKSIILIADVYKSISIIRFQEEYRTLSLVSRDFQALNVYDIEFMVDNSNLGFLVSDSEENFVIFMYQPESRESFGGQKLLRKADYHLGQKVNTMFRIQCSQKGNLMSRSTLSYDKKHMVVFGTLDGGLGYCLPLPEKTYRRLFMLQNVLLLHKEHLCGLNPKAFRTIKTGKKLQSNPARCIVDGELVWSYLNLPLSEKMEVAKKIGTKMEEVYADLLEIENVTLAF